MSRGIKLVLVRLVGGIQTGKEPSRALRIAGPLPSTGSEAQGGAPSHHLVSRKGKKRRLRSAGGCRPLSRDGFGLGFSLNLFVLL